jgi:hypothetical protein
MSSALRLIVRHPSLCNKLVCRFCERVLSSGGHYFLCSVLLYPKEHCLFQGSQVSPACPPEKSSIRIEISTERWWNDVDKGKRKDPRKTSLSARLFTTNLTSADVELESGFRA